MEVRRNNDNLIIIINKSDGYLYTWLANGDTEEILKTSYTNLTIYNDFVDRLFDVLKTKDKEITNITSKNNTLKNNDSFNIVAKPQKKIVDLNELENKLKNFL